MTCVCGFFPVRERYVGNNSLMSFGLLPLTKADDKNAAYLITKFGIFKLVTEHKKTRMSGYLTTPPVAFMARAFWRDVFFT